MTQDEGIESKIQPDQLKSKGFESEMRAKFEELKQQRITYALDPYAREYFAFEAGYRAATAESDKRIREAEAAKAWNTRTPDLSKLKSDETVLRIAQAVRVVDLDNLKEQFDEPHGSIAGSALIAKAALAEVERILKDD